MHRHGASVWLRQIGLFALVVAGAVLSGGGHVAARGIQGPTIVKSFTDPIVPVGGTTLLTFTITNVQAGSTFTSVGFTDTFPAGLVLGTPAVSLNGCGGTLTAANGGTSVVLSGATLIPTEICIVVVHVVGLTPGPLVNTSSGVSTAEVVTGSGSTATLTVDPAVPVVSWPVLFALTMIVGGLGAAALRRRLGALA